MFARLEWYTRTSWLVKGACNKWSAEAKLCPLFLGSRLGGEGGDFSERHKMAEAGGALLAWNLVASAYGKSAGMIGYLTPVTTEPATNLGSKSDANIYLVRPQRVMDLGLYSNLDESRSNEVDQI